MVKDIERGAFVARVLEIGNSSEYGRKIVSTAMAFPNLMNDLAEHYERHDIPMHMRVFANGLIIQVLMAFEDPEAPLGLGSMAVGEEKRDA